MPFLCMKVLGVVVIAVISEDLLLVLVVVAVIPVMLEVLGVGGLGEGLGGELISRSFSLVPGGIGRFDNFLVLKTMGGFVGELADFTETKSLETLNLDMIELAGKLSDGKTWES